MMEGSGFIAKISVHGLLNLGMSTPLQLESSIRQMAFKGAIKNQRLKRILRRHEGLLLPAVKLILGKDSLSTDEFYRVDSHISSRFLASILDARVPKEASKSLMLKLFKPKILGGLNTILGAVIPGAGISRPNDIASPKDPLEVVKVSPLVLDLKGMALIEHQDRVLQVYGFLQNMLSEDRDIGEGEWVGKLQSLAVGLGLL